MEWSVKKKNLFDPALRGSYFSLAEWNIILGIYLQTWTFVSFLSREKKREIFAVFLPAGRFDWSARIIFLEIKFNIKYELSGFNNRTIKNPGRCSRMSQLVPFIGRPFRDISRFVLKQTASNKFREKIIWNEASKRKICLTPPCGGVIFL